MTRNQFIFVTSLAAMVLYALVANWVIRSLLASTCDDFQHVRLNAQSYRCEPENR